jgi:hypothetical protein
VGSAITGRDPNAAAWPIVCEVSKILQGPTGYTFTGASSAVNTLRDSLDNTMIFQNNTDRYFYAQVEPFALPRGARITSCSPYVRARVHAGNTRWRDFVVAIADHSAPNALVHYSPTTHVQIAAGAWGYTGASRILTSQNKPINQLDINKGMVIMFGLNSVYGALPNGADIIRANMRYTYDMPPSAVVTSPANASTLLDTNAPIIQWDYFDDFQPQAKFQVKVTTNAGLLIHDSGVKTSSDTFYALPVNLDNGDYVASVSVWQRWNQPGGDFKALNPATTVFTVGVQRLGTPRLTINTVNEHTELTVYPDVNLFTYEQSSGNRGSQGWYTSGSGTVSPGTTVHSGTGSFKVTMTGATVTAFPELRQTCKAGDVFKMNGWMYLNGAAASGRQVRLGMEFYDANNVSLGVVVASSWTPLTLGGWVSASVTNLLAPANAVRGEVRLFAQGMVNGDVWFFDDMQLLWQGSPITRENLNKNPRLNNGITGYVSTGNAPPTVAVVAGDSMAGTNALKVTATGANNFFPGVAQAAIPTVVGATYTVSAYVKIPSAGGVSTVSGIVNGANVFTNVVGTKDTWTRIYATFQAVSTSTTVTWFFNGADLAIGQYFLLSALMFELNGTLLPYFDGTSSGAVWTGTADNSTSLVTTTFPAWTRGGFYTATPNAVSYADSSFESNEMLWQPVPNFPATSLSLDTTQTRHGAQSGLLQSLLAGTNTLRIDLGTQYYIPINNGDTVAVGGSVRGSVSGRVVDIGFDVYDANFVPLGYIANTANTIANTWVDIINSALVVSGYPLAAYISPYISVAGVAATTEKYNVDSYFLIPGGIYKRFWPGFFPDSDEAPSVLVEYSDDAGTTWKDLGRVQTVSTAGAYKFYDYSLRTGTTRVYRASLYETQNSVQLNSDTTALVSGVVSLKATWIAADIDPVGTSYNFLWDGEGRGRMLNAEAALVDIDGRAYPFPQFSEANSGTLDATIALDTAADIAALERIALSKSTITYRDSRGRSVRGTIGPVQFVDVPQTGLQRASFTITLSGEQP